MRHMPTGRLVRILTLIVGVVLLGAAQVSAQLRQAYYISRVK